MSAGAAQLRFTIAFSASLLAVSLRFWFYWPTLLTGTATLCFTIAAVLSV